LYNIRILVQRVNHFLCVSERERERESYYLLAMRIRTIGINEQLRLNCMGSIWNCHHLKMMFFLQIK
jgi:hypothetical protein